MGETVYIRIAENIDKHAAGAPKSKGKFSRAFMEYLKMLYPRDEADLVQYLKMPKEILPDSFDPSQFMSAVEVAALSGRRVEEVKTILDDLVRRNRIVGANVFTDGSVAQKAGRVYRVLKNFHYSLGLKGTLKRLFETAATATRDARKYGLKKAGGLFNISLYCLPHFPVLLNVHQIYREIEPDDIKAAEAYQEFFIRDGYYKYYEGSEKGTPTVRVINVERTVEVEQKILDFQDAHKIIDASPSVGMISCPCRTRTEKLGIRECKDQNPVGSCILVGFAAIQLEALGRGRIVTHEQAKKYLDDMQDMGLVAVSDNWRKAQAVICLCCSCCCSMARGRTRWDNPSAISPSVFAPRADDNCKLCGKCVKRCFFNALSIDKKAKKVKVDMDTCIGCGVCTIACENNALKLHDAGRRVGIPANAKVLYERIERENKALRE